MARDERKELGPCEGVRRNVERMERTWRVYHDAMDEEDAFRDGDRYVNNSDYNNRDRRLVQIRGQETEDTIRHMKAVWLQKPRNLQARPFDRMGDAAAAEYMCSLLEHELRNPYKGFERELYKVIDASRSHRLGVMWQDWHPEVGAWGEIFDTEEDARNFMWDPARHPHHPLSRYLVRQRRMDVDEARESFNANWLEPDRMMRSRLGRADLPIGQGSFQFEPTGDDDCVTLWECWYKNDRSKKYRDKKNGKENILPMEQRYMACSDGCGWRSPRQGETEEVLPEAVDQGCPVCGGNIERIDSLAEQESIYQFSRGKHLIIMAPWQTIDDEPLYDGNWPIPTARSYPILTIFAELRSGRLMGGSDVSRAWGQQIANDQLATMMVQQAFNSQPFYAIPENGAYKDRDGRRWEMRDDQERVLYRDDTAEFNSRGIERFDGGGLDPAVLNAYNVIHNELTAYRGTSDLGLTEESSKDIAVGTVEAIERQGNLPSLDFAKRGRWDIGIYIGVKSDYISATYPPARLVRMNFEGTDEILEVWGRDMPGMDYEIEDTPDFTGLEEQRVKALSMLEQMANEALMQGLPPEIASKKISLYAEEMHFPPSTVKKFQDYLAEVAAFQAEQQAQAAAQAEEQAAQDMEAGVGVPGFQPSDEELMMMDAQAAQATPPQA